jgi:hypothetical protein
LLLKLETPDEEVWADGETGEADSTFDDVDMDRKNSELVPVLGIDGVDVEDANLREEDNEDDEICL